jgi:hypothetical protein
MGFGEEAVRTCDPRRSSQAQAKTEQGWQGRNRRSLEEAVGGKEGGDSETEASRHKEGRCQEGGGEEGTSKGRKEECASQESGGEEVGTEEIRPGKVETYGQEGCEEVGSGDCPTLASGGISIDAGSRGAVDGVHGPGSRQGRNGNRRSSKTAGNRS